MMIVLILQILGPYSNDILVFVTVALAVLTGFYAVQTKKTVQVLEKTASLEVLPKIKGHLHMIGPMALNFRVSNIGRGPANDVQVDFTVLGLNTIKRTWKQQLLTPGQFQDFFIPISEGEEQHYITYFETNETKIKLSSICKDVIGKNHSNQEEIDVSEYVKQFKRTKSVYAEDRLDTISRNMKSIPDELKMISRNISSIGIFL